MNWMRNESAPAAVEDVATRGAPRVPGEPDALPKAAARFLTREPLLDGEYRVIGYELKVNEKTPLPVLPGATSLRQVRDEALLVGVIDMRYQQALSRKFTLLELAPATLDNPMIALLPKENVILAVNTPSPDPALLARCQELARQGYALALDEKTLIPGLTPLARECRYLRLDVADNGLMALCDRLSRIQGIRGPRLIARNVETEEAFLACRKLKFDLYQGYFFTQSGTVPSRRIDAARPRIMNLLNLLTSHADHAAIEAEFKLDPALAYKLLRYINSPAVGLRYPVRSIAHALLMLGHEPLYRWLLLLLFGHENGDGRDRALLMNALIRARLMETLGGPDMEPGLRGGLFIVGILSMIDALLNVPMREALAPLKLAPAIVDALLSGDGVYAPYLALAEACESSDAERLAMHAATLGWHAEMVNEAHLGALVWSEGIDL